jgi:membrane protease YdiL (CAAX protease family)
MMAAMTPATVLIFCATLASVGTGSAVLYELNADGSASLSPAEIITRFVLLLALSLSGIYAARQSGLPGSLVLTSENRWTAIRDFMIYGVWPGLVLGVVNYLMFFGYRYSPLVQPGVRNIGSAYDSLVVSLNAAVSEEVLFRLFIVSALVLFLRQIYEKVFHVWPRLSALAPGVVALVASSLVFAVAHNVYGFTAAFFGGMVLGILYMNGGVESAIAAHFVANLLFFSASYLN